jgi:hypothetical protein
MSNLEMPNWNYLLNPHAHRELQSCVLRWLGLDGQESKRPASLLSGGPLRNAVIGLILTMAVRTAATAMGCSTASTMRGTTTTTVRGASTTAGMWSATAAVTAARSGVGSGWRRVRARWRGIVAIVGWRVPLRRVRATAVGIAAAISLSARTSPRWAIV